MAEITSHHKQIKEDFKNVQNLSEIEIDGKGNIYLASYVRSL